MLSNYFKKKTSSKNFEENLSALIDKLKNKKVLLYGAGEGFWALNKKYSFNSNLEIVAIADKKFEDSADNKANPQQIDGIRTIKPEDILNENYDVVLVTNEYARPILNYLENQLRIERKDINLIFEEEIPDESINTNYLYEYKFEKTLPKIIKKLKNKKVMLYGAGSFLELIIKNYDLSELNIIGVSDKRFFTHEENEQWHNYKVYSIVEMKDAKPDYILVATKFYINIIEDMHYNILKGTNIKVKPLLKKPFLTLLKEVLN